MLGKLIEQEIQKILAKMIGWIVIIIIGIGSIATAFYVLNPSRRQPIRRFLSRQLQPNEIPKNDAVLCLIIPTDRIDAALQKNLLPRVKLTIEETKILIEKSDYFIACAAQTLDAYIGRLNLSTAPINYAEDGEIYIQLLLTKGEDTIGIEVQRSLLESLRDIAIIEGVYLLNDLSNIDRFHR